MIGPSGCGKTTLLTAIIGMNKLNSGEIIVLGEKLKSFELPRSVCQIGFMPQDISLHVEFTVEETLNYYGNLYQVDSGVIYERSRMLGNLLELPPDNRKINDCSGGQQRRVSLAVAMMHNPRLLILDEPTVGVDPLLREKIWDFLRDLTSNSEMVIVITTHYIEEAQKVDRCGLMRNGIILAEDAPQVICDKLEVNDLSEAFLKLCYAQTNCEHKSKIVLEQHVPETCADENLLVNEKRKMFHKNTMKALLYKSYIQVFRQSA